MRYVVEKLPSTADECPFCQPSFNHTEFFCNVNYQSGDLCSLFTKCPYPPTSGQCNGLIEFATLVQKGENHA